MTEAEGGNLKNYSMKVKLPHVTSPTLVNESLEGQSPLR